jgi:hypothetical protein
MLEELAWSGWLDFSQEQTSKVPESCGVFMMHAAMKILYIGGSGNMKSSIVELAAKECTCNSKRFKYAHVENYEQVRDTLIQEYKQKHSGSMPICM